MLYVYSSTVSKMIDAFDTTRKAGAGEVYANTVLVAHPSRFESLR